MVYAVLYSGWRNEKKFIGYDDLIKICTDYETALKYANEYLEKQQKEIEHNICDYCKEDLFIERKNGTKTEIHKLIIDCHPYGRYVFECEIKPMELE